MAATSAPAPAPTRPPRLAPLAKLPLFLDLAGRRALLIGGGEPAVWKAELLLAAGARLEVLAEEVHPDLLAAFHSTEGRASRSKASSRGGVTTTGLTPPRFGFADSALPSGEGEAGLLSGEGLRDVEGEGCGSFPALHRRPWTEADLAGVAIVVADLDDLQEAARLAAACRARGVPLNVIDKPAFCDFQFGTIVNRSPVVVGIMTDGAAPILGQAIRRRIEAVLPPGLAGWATLAKGFRGRLKALLPGRTERRMFWEGFVDRVFAPGGGAPDADLLGRLARGIAEGGSGRAGRTGEVVLVGAGPGDPELLTLKAMRELQAADVIVYDRLVTPEVLELGRREARRIHVGKEGHGASCRQEDISALLVDLALAGERVVRLKGGDPSVFGRSGEEVEACRAAGVPVRIVPGVTTASAAAASLGLSLTHRDAARRLQFVTGHDRSGRLPEDLDIAALADPGATLVVYMGRRTAAGLAGRLIAAGLDPATPVVAVAYVSRPTQTEWRADLGRLRDGGVDLPEGAPVIVMIGAAFGDRVSDPVASAVSAG